MAVDRALAKIEEALDEIRQKRAALETAQSRLNAAQSHLEESEEMLSQYDSTGPLVGVRGTKTTAVKKSRPVKVNFGTSRTSHKTKNYITAGGFRSKTSKFAWDEVLTKAMKSPTLAGRAVKVKEIKAEILKSKPGMKFSDSALRNRMISRTRGPNAIIHRPGVGLYTYANRQKQSPRADQSVV